MSDEEERISEPLIANITIENQEHYPEVFMDSSSQSNLELPSNSQGTIPDEYLDEASYPNIQITSNMTHHSENSPSTSQQNLLITAQEQLSEDSTSHQNVHVTPNTSQDRISDEYLDSTSQASIQDNANSSQENNIFVEANEDLDSNSSDEEFHDSIQEIWRNRQSDLQPRYEGILLERLATPPLEGLERVETPELFDGIPEYYARDAVDVSLMDEEEQDYDIRLAAYHSYLGPGLVSLGGRVVLEAGWVGLVPVLGHSGPVFPGETVPLCLMRPLDVELMQHALQGNKLFGLLSPHGSWTHSSGYGSLCEVYEASEPSEDGQGRSLNVLARATHRFRLTAIDGNRQNIGMYDSVVVREVEVLPELCLGNPLYPIRLTSLDQHRGTKSRWIRDMESVMSTWPRFLFEVTDMTRIKKTIYEFFKNKHDKMPEDTIPLSFWVASNLPLNKRDGLSLLMVDEALLRLTMEAEIIARINILCCCSCKSMITKLEHTFAMSSEGLHSNYTNRYGYLHDVITTSQAHNVSDGSESVMEYSWFPGYAWTIQVCSVCHSHVGWRFDAFRRNLRPSRFYGISRNYVQPLSVDEPIEGVPTDTSRT